MATKNGAYGANDTAVEDEASGAYSPADQPVDLPPASAARKLGDVGIALGQGAVGGVKAIADAAGAGSRVSNALDSANQSLSGFLSPQRAREIAARQETIKAAEATGSTWDEIGANLGGFAEAPASAIAQGVGSIAPTIAAAFIPGGRRAAVARGAAMLGLGAAQGAGAVKGSIYDAVQQKQIDAGMTPENAQQAAGKAQEYTGDNAGQIALGAGLGAVAGRVGAEGAIARLTGGQPAKLGALRRLATGAAEEGITEGAQGGQERLASNLALQNEGFDTPTMQGVAGQAALEGVVGGIVGGGVGAIAAPAPPASPNSQLVGVIPSGEDGGNATAETQLKPPATGSTGQAGSSVIGGQSAPGEGISDVLAVSAKGAADQSKAEPSIAQSNGATEGPGKAAGFTDHGGSIGFAQDSSPSSIAEDFTNGEGGGVATSQAPVSRSQAMGIDPSAGAISAAAAVAVDTGADVITQTQAAQKAQAEADAKVKPGKDGKPGAKPEPQAPAPVMPAAADPTAPITGPFTEAVHGGFNVAPSQTPAASTQGPAPAQPADAPIDGAVAPGVGADQGTQGPGAVPDAVSQSIPTTQVTQETIDANQTSTQAPTPGTQGTGGDSGQRPADALDTGADATRTDATGQPATTQGGAATAQVRPTEPVDVGAHTAATSPLNNLPEPTQAQKEAGNYRKGALVVGGLDISIENPEGSTRSGTDPDGKAWSNTMTGHYGYVKRTTGSDGEQQDVYIKPGTPLDYAGPVFVVDQIDPKTGKHDEFKSMVGYANALQARQAYQKNYAPGWKGLKSIKAMPWDEFKAWVKGDGTKAVGAPSSPIQSGTGTTPTASGKPQVSPGPSTSGIELSRGNPAPARTSNQGPSPSTAPAGPASQTAATAALAVPAAAAPQVQAGQGSAGPVAGSDQQPTAGTRRPSASSGQPAPDKSESNPSTNGTPPPAKSNGLRVGTMPTNAEPVTIKDGVLFIGKYEALNFDTGEPIKISDGSNGLQIRKALADNKALGAHQKVFGGVAEAPAETATKAAEPAEKSAIPPDVKTAPDKPLNPLQQRIADAERKRADYFTPGNIVQGYGGYDRVISYTPGPPWSVKVVEVRKTADGWVDIDARNVRNHSTQPDAKEFARGPLGSILPKAADIAAPATKPENVLSINTGGSVIDLTLDNPAWQTTDDELVRAVNDSGTYLGNPGSKYDPYMAWREAHGEAIARAAREGKKFPDNVLYDKPHLIRSDLSDDQSDIASDAMVDEYRSTKDYAKAVQVYRDYGKKSAAPVESDSTPEAEPATQAATILDAANVTGSERLSIIKDVKSGALTPDEVQAAYPDATPAKSKERLTDAGEELIRNRRGKLKGLAWDDVSAMNDTLKVAQVIKSNVWPRPDYAKMVEDGAPAWKAAALKAVYDKLAAAPVTRAAPTDSDLRAYIETMNQVREALTAELDRVERDGTGDKLWASLQARNVFGKVFPIPADAKPVYGAPSPFDRKSEQGKENNRRALLIGGNGAIQALQFNYKVTSKVKDLLADGFPKKQEAWEKSYEVRQTETRDNDVPQDERNGEPQQRFYVYEKGSRWRLAKGVQDGGYATQEQAEAFARTLTARKRDVLPPSRGLDLADVKRTGPDWRGGKNVTSDQVMEHFGFRGVNLGEYVKAKQDIAQLHLNHVFDAFSDLADLLGVPPKAMSLNGTLGVAVGAQGSGKALAHFVPGVNEINITRDSGAGALAHEFGHAVDHYFATQHGRAASMAKRPYLSAVVENVNDAGGVRPEVMSAMRTVVKAINSRPMTEAEAKKYMADQRALNERRMDRWVTEFKGNRGADPEALAAVAEKLKRGDVGEIRDDDVESNLAEFMRAAGLKPGNMLAANAFTTAYRLRDLADEARFLASHIPQMETNYSKASAALDAKKTGDGYWGTPWEKFARAFETFVMDALVDRQRESLYLSGLVDSKGWQTWSDATGKSIPYPAGDERLVMQQAFQQLVDTIQTKDDDAGSVAMFARGQFDRAPTKLDAAGLAQLETLLRAVTPSNAMGVAQVRSIVDTLAKKWTLPVQVVATPKDLPIAAPSDARGLYMRGTVYVVASTNPTKASVLRTLGHEAIAHHGLRSMLGPDDWRRMMNQIQFAIKAGNKPLREISDYIRRTYVDENGKFELTPAQEADEIAAKAVEDAIDPVSGEFRPGFGWLKSVFARVAQFLRDMGINVPFTNIELQGALVSSMRNLEAGGRLQGQGGAVAAARDGALARGLSGEPVPVDVVVDGSHPYAKLIGDLDRGDASAIKALQFAKFFGDLLVSVGIQPSIGESFGDGLMRNAKRLSDIGKTASFIEHGYGGLDTPSKLVVMQAVGDAIYNRKVLDSVVEAIPIDMMNVLAGKEFSAGSLLNHMAMFTNIASVDAQNPVAAAIHKAALVIPKVSAGDGAKGSAGLGNVGRVSIEGRSANGAMTGNHRHGAASSWDSPEASKFDAFVYTLQDRQIDTKRVVQAIRETSQALADQADVYLQEELFHGRAAKRTQDFVDRELRPMLTTMQLAGIKIEALDKFLHARHAKEANELIAQRNPGIQDAGSGMSTADAQAYLAGLDPNERRRLEAVAKQVDAIIAGTRSLYVAYGLESADTVAGWETMFKSYVPLMREEHDGGMGIGQGFSIKGRETKGRTGSANAKVIDILANIAMQRERAVVRGEKNRVSTALVGLATMHPNQDFWSVGPPPPIQVYNPKTNTVEDRVDPLFKSRENVVVAKVMQPDGSVQERAVVFNDADERALRMAKSLKNLDTAQLEGLLGTSAKITRYFASINTQFNPVFGTVNLVRDVQGAMLNLTSTPLAGRQKEIMGHTLSALRGIYIDARDERRGIAPTSAWASLWSEFQDEGGQTGFRDLFRTSKDRTDAIEREMDPTKWMESPLGKFFTAGGRLKVPLAVAQKGATGMFGWLSDYNLAMENAVRLAAYKVALEQGMSKQQAASLGKNLTVNFNRKGQVGQQAGALFAFFNAAVQGTARLGQTLFDMDGSDASTIRLSSKGKKIVYGGMLLGSMQALLLAAAGFDDEEPPDFVRERSLIIPTGGKTYITIPMPLGLHVLPNLGRIPTEFALGGFKKPVHHVVKMFGLAVDAFSPVGGGASVVQAMAPTAIDPIVALAENRDWTGKPIAKTSYNRATPGHQLAKDTASAPARMLSEAINYLSGGTEYVRGVFSPTPDQIDYLWGQITGGVGREAAKVDQTVSAALSGEDLPPHKIPLLGRFYGNADAQTSQSGSFYANLNRINEHEAEVKGLRKAGQGAEASQYVRANPEARLIMAANAVERQVQKLRVQKRDLLAKDAPAAQVREVERQISEKMRRFNEIVRGLQQAA